MPKDDREEEHWHLSKKVPITLIAAIITQTFIIGIFIARIDFTVNANAKWIEENKNLKTEMVLIRQRVGELSKLVVRLENILQSRMYPIERPTR